MNQDALKRSILLRIPKLLLVLTFAFSCTAKSRLQTPTREQSEVSLKIFSKPLQDTQGREVSLAKLQASEHSPPVAYHFFASWCQSCREEIATLTKISASGNPSVKIVHISLDETKEDAEAVLKESGLQNQNLIMDPGGSILTSLGEKSIPFTVAFNSQGELKIYEEGPVLSLPATLGQLNH